ncbi:MAG TPA: hypothetical protein VGG34_14940 [Opitutaceae bacterium]|jgi:hypothetical protein
MNIKRTLVPIALFIAASATPSYAQVFWSNYSPSGVTDNIWCVTYADGIFAAVTDQGNLLTSANGTTWNSKAIDAGVWLVSIAYGNGMWIAVGANGTILESPDLNTWVHASSVTSNRLNGVLYTGAVWVAAGEAGTIITSLDGQNWELQPAIPGITGYLHGLTYVPASSDTIDSVGNTIWISGENGALIQGTAPNNGTNFTFSVATNPLTGGQLPFSANLENILCAGIASPSLVGVGQGFLFYSESTGGIGFGQSFRVSPTTPPNVDFRGLAYGNGYFIAAGEQGTIFRSTDGINWVQSYSGDSPSTLSTSTLLSVAYSSTLQRFVATGTGGAILVSNPPPTVFGNVSTRGYVSPTQTFIGGFYVQGTAPRTVLIRGDGPVLGTFNVPGPLADPVLTVYDSNGNVVATNTGWSTNKSPSDLSVAALAVGAFALPASSADSALLLTLAPGAYTAQITSAKGNSGIALFEAYTD